MADTTDFGDGGYPLWLARWTRAPLPVVPGLNWADFGWTFWQWTSCGHVPGIRGCVDLDRFADTDLSPVLLGDPPVNVDPPTVTGTAAVGQTLIAAPGSWLGTSTFAFRWERCDALGANCRPIPGATKPVYLVAPADEGSTLVVAVTGGNRVGSESAESQPTSIVP
jgi:hypothetical protein